MTNLDRVAYEIKSVGLYDLILQDIKNILKTDKPTIEQIREILDTHPEILKEYKQTNVEYNLSNIHLKEIPLEKIPAECKNEAKKYNQNLNILKEIEKYTLDFEHSSTLVIIFSIEFFVLFSVQYFIVLLNLKAYQIYIYALFLLSILIAWLYAKKVKKRYEIESKRFQQIYDETLKILNQLEDKNCIKKEQLWIMESDEHV